MSAAWRAEPERGTPAATALMARLALALGRRATRWLLVPICLYFYAFAPRARRASRAFLARALGREPSAAEILRHHHAFASTLHDRVFLLAGRHAALQVEVSGAEEVERLLARGAGCLLVGSHLGSFEVLRALGRAGGRPVNVVMNEDHARNTAAVFARLAPPVARQVITSDRPGAMLRVKECLERGEIVGMLADRPLAAGRTAPRRFLGEEARFPLGPWLAASALGAPLVLFFGLYRGGARYEVRFELLWEGGRVPREERERATLGWLERYVARLEHHARAAPYNWFNFYDFWAAPDAR